MKKHCYVYSYKFHFYFLFVLKYCCPSFLPQMPGSPHPGRWYFGENWPLPGSVFLNSLMARRICGLYRKIWWNCWPRCPWLSVRGCISNAMVLPQITMAPYQHTWRNISDVEDRSSRLVLPIRHLSTSTCGAVGLQHLRNYEWDVK